MAPARASHRRSLRWLAGLVALAAPPAQAALLYVAATGSDTASCTSPGSPCRNIQRAVNVAQTGDEIRVAQGTYVYQAALDTQCSANLFDTAVVCIINKELTLRGGFDGSNWTQPGPDLHETVIDGQDARRGILVTDVSGPESTASLVLEGFTVTRGRGGPATGGLGDAVRFGFGGGLQSVLARTVIRSVLFLDNRAIGANVASSPEYGGSGVGGGVALQSAPAGSSLEDVRFVGNEARGGSGPQRGGYGIGGGLYTYNSTLTAARLHFEDNLAVGGSSTGDGIQSDGELADAQGGGAAFHLGSDVTLTDVVALNNQSLGGVARNSAGGQAGWGFGGGLYAEGQLSPNDTHLTLTRVRLEGNRATGGAAYRGGGSGGGGIMSSGADLTVDRALLLSNRSEGGNGNSSGGQRGAAGGGGGYFGRGSEPVQVQLTNCVVASNEAIEGATGAISGGGGGGLWIQGLPATIRHCTLHDNRLNQPYSGLGILLIENVTGANVLLEDSIVSGHTLAAGAAAIHVRSTSALTVGPGLFSGNGDNSNSGDGDAGTYANLASMTTVGSIGYRSAGAPQFDYRLLPGSPAVDLDAGSTEAFDFEGQARAGARDVGADELGSPAPIFSDDFESGRPWAWTLVVRP